MRYLGLVVVLLAACERQEPDMVAVPGHAGAMKTIATVRAQRRAYDGAPPVIPHKDFSVQCMNCHVFQNTDDVFVASTFEGMQQDLRHGDRLHPLAPPVMPHRVFMRENCRACHSGPAAREEIRCSHPERPRCLQCHLPRMTTDVFER